MDFARFCVGALFGSFVAALCGVLVVSFGVVTLSGLTVSAFCGAIAGVACLIGGRLA